MDRAPKIEKRKRKGATLSILITEGMKAMLEARAEAEGVKPHALMVKLIGEICGQVPQFYKDDLTRLDRSIVELNAIGRNVNQIARAAHQNPSKIVVESALLKEVIAKIDAVSGSIIEIAARQTERWKRSEK